MSISINGKVRERRQELLSRWRKNRLRCALALAVVLIAMAFLPRVLQIGLLIPAMMAWAGLVAANASPAAFKLGWRLGVESEHWCDPDNSHGPISTPSGWIDADARCVCGAPWIDDECGRGLFPPEVCGYPASGDNPELLDQCGRPLRCTRPAGHDLLPSDDPRRYNHSNPSVDWVWRTRLRARDAR